ncbi:MAG: lpxH [Gammaproteobacteria bacterium]|jgi:UDP-2,3-diacylglucosamine hydrolase|nr:lpxH [Gammaproteobacteria bacterium]
MRHTLFISDIHLENKREDITQCFLGFLKTQAPKADALYILGDLFEAWIGDDNNTPFHQTIMQAIQALSMTMPVYVMRGNRDFLIGQEFAKQTGCTLLADPSLIILYGKQLLLSHGDMLCTDDVKHQKFRTLSQNSTYNRYFLCLPLAIRKWIARIIRGKSQQHIQRSDYAIMDVNQDAVVDLMEGKGVDLLIHGHTHRPYIHEVKLVGCIGRRIVLGDWHEGWNFLMYGEDGKIVFNADKYPQAG